MSNARNEIWDLCDFLEAELDGRPYDRNVALELAERLGSKFPSIHQRLCASLPAGGQRTGPPVYGRFTPLP